MIQETRRRRTEIEFVRHGLFQKCNKESRLTIFGNRENIMRMIFPHFGTIGRSWLHAEKSSREPDIKIDIDGLLRRVTPEQLETG